MDLAKIFSATSDRHVEIMRDDLSEIYFDAARADVEYVFDDSITAISSGDRVGLAGDPGGGLGVECGAQARLAELVKEQPNTRHDRWLTEWPPAAPASPRVAAVDSPQSVDLDVVRDSYDRVADNYVDMVTTTGVGDIRTHPWLRAMMDAFADAVGGLGPVLDVGCGPGTVTAYLAERGVDVAGVDLSPRMIEHARRLHPECTFSVGSSTELELAEASWGGLLGWWSLFNLPRHVLPRVLSSFARALMPQGQLMIATHVGDGDVARTEAYGGVPVRWTTYRWQPDQLAALVEQAGLRPTAELRLPADELTGPTVVLVAQREGGPS